MPRAGHQAVLVSPAPTAMVWNSPSQPHECVAVPGVELREGETLVQVELATVCGSDVHTVTGARPAPAPLVLGHEQVGSVVALGPGEPIRTVDGTVLQRGDRVVWTVTVSCGTCDRCRAGVTQKCRTLRKYGHERLERGWELSGGFATHVHLRAGTGIVRVPESMPASLAAPASCSTATAVAALDAARVPIDGGTLLVGGAGMIGLTIAAIATEAGADVAVIDPDPERRAMARRFGAEVVIDPASSSLLERLRECGLSDPVAAIDASGSADSVRALIDAVDVGGVVVLVGSVSPGPAVPLDPESVVRRLVTVTGVHNYAPRHLQAAVDFLSTNEGAPPFERLVGATYPLSRLEEALADARSGRHIRVGIDPTGFAAATV